ncbi:MAG: type II secretion system F family protein [Deltaproteobacteria bacterium]|nr:type II secretion system F family protein [Deltaproteobacteria bacterium]
MNNYLFKAVNVNGEVIKGITMGLDASSVQSNLTDKGLYVLYIKDSSRYLKIISDKLTIWRIKRKDVIEFSSSLAIMLRAGVPIMTAMEDIIATMANESMKATLTDIKINIEMGVKFSDALDLHKNIFPDILIRLVRVGEETGRLDQSLAEVASHLQKLEDLAATVKRALIYPLFSLITTGAAVIFWLAYVLPKIMQVIIGLGVKMPLLTNVLYEVSKITEKFWYVALLIPIMIVVALQLMKLKASTRYYLDLLKINLPIVKLLFYNKLLALFAEQLRLMISAGITIDRSLDVAADVMGNEVFKCAIINSKREIMAGGKISDALAAQKIFPPMFIRMVSIGETSGNLDQQFGFLAEHYYRIVDDFSDKIGKMIEPLLMIFLGLLMGIMIAGVMLPMYDIFSKIGS